MLWTEAIVDELVRCVVQGTVTDQLTHPHSLPSHTHKPMDGEMGNPKNSVSSLFLQFSFSLFPLFSLFASLLALLTSS